MKPNKKHTFSNKGKEMIQLGHQTQDKGMR